MKKITLSRIGEVLQKMYDTGISLGLSSEPDCGYAYRGETENFEIEIPVAYPEGYNCERIEDVISPMADNVCTRFPKHEFSKWYQDTIGFDEPGYVTHHIISIDHLTERS